MSAKAERRARKKLNRRLRRPACEECGLVVDEGPLGQHCTPWSCAHVGSDGVAIVAWCQRCGHEYAS